MASGLVFLHEFAGSLVLLEGLIVLFKLDRTFHLLQSIRYVLVLSNDGRLPFELVQEGGARIENLRTRVILLRRHQIRSALQMPQIIILLPLGHELLRYG